MGRRRVWPVETLTTDQRSAVHVACWLAYLRLDVIDVLALTDAREAAAGRPVPAPNEAPALWWGGWNQRQDDYAEVLELGRWYVFGDTSPSPCHAVKAALDDGLQPTGVPSLSADDLRQYLDEVLDGHRSTVAGRNAITDRRVLGAVCDVAFTARTLEPGAGVRRLTERLSDAEQAVAAALKRLSRDGFLLPVALSGAGNETRYLITGRKPTLPDPSHLDISSPLGSIKKCDELGSVRADHPAFHRSALGPTRLELLRVLVACRPSSNREWSTLAGVSERQFYKLLKGLNGTAGLPPVVTQTNGGWELVAEIDRLLDAVAEECGTAGVHDRRRDRHRRERRGHAEYLVRQLPERFQVTEDAKVLNTSTGELLRAAQLVDRMGRPLPAVGGEQETRPQAPAAVASAAAPPLTICVGCGWTATTVEPSSGAVLHNHCTVPAWIARHLRNTYGIEIPTHRINTARLETEQHDEGDHQWLAA